MRRIASAERRPSVVRTVTSQDRARTGVRATEALRRSAWRRAAHRRGLHPRGHREKARPRAAAILAARGRLCRRGLVDRASAASDRLRARSGLGLCPWRCAVHRVRVRDRPGTFPHRFGAGAPASPGASIRGGSVFAHACVFHNSTRHILGLSAISTDMIRFGAFLHEARGTENTVSVALDGQGS